VAFRSMIARGLALSKTFGFKLFLFYLTYNSNSNFDAKKTFGNQVIDFK